MMVLISKPHSYSFNHFKKTHTSSTFIEWSSENSNPGTSGINTLTNNDTTNVYIRMQVVFMVSTSDTYNFKLRSDDGIRIKVVDYSDTKPDSDVESDWPSMTNLSGNSEVNWAGHGQTWFQYSKYLEKYKVYKAYMEYNQGTGGYVLLNHINRNDNITNYRWDQHPNMILMDNMASFNTTTKQWVDRDSFTGGGGLKDISEDNIYLESTKNYEFFIEYSNNTGSLSFNLYAEKILLTLLHQYQLI